MGRIGGSGGKESQTLFFNRFCLFLVINEWPWWPIGFLYEVMCVQDIMGDIIG
jgi:hypothetical protein